MYTLSPTPNEELATPSISSRVSLPSPTAVTMIPSLPLTVEDLPCGLTSSTNACSSYLLGCAFTLCKTEPPA